MQKADIISHLVFDVYSMYLLFQDKKNLFSRSSVNCSDSVSFFVFCLSEFIPKNLFA